MIFNMETNEEIPFANRKRNYSRENRDLSDEKLLITVIALVTFQKPRGRPSPPQGELKLRENPRVSTLFDWILSWSPLGVPHAIVLRLRSIECGQSYLELALTFNLIIAARKPTPTPKYERPTKHRKSIEAIKNQNDFKTASGRSLGENILTRSRERFFLGRKICCTVRIFVSVDSAHQ